MKYINIFSMVFLHMLSPIESHARSQAPIVANLQYVGSAITVLVWTGAAVWGDPVKCPAPAKFAFINGTNNYSPNYPVACEIVGQGTDAVNVRSKFGACYFDCYVQKNGLSDLSPTTAP